ECADCHKKVRANRFQARKHLYDPARKRWYVENLDRVDFSRARTRARKAGATEFMSFEEWTTFRASTQCHWCGLDLHISFRTIDHVRPLVYGGQHTVDNVVASCWNCNMRREWERKTKHGREGA